MANEPQKHIQTTKWRPTNKKRQKIAIDQSNTTQNGDWLILLRRDKTAGKKPVGGEQQGERKKNKRGHKQNRLKAKNTRQTKKAVRKARACAWACLNLV